MTRYYLDTYAIIEIIKGKDSNYDKWLAFVNEKIQAKNIMEVKA